VAVLGIVALLAAACGSSSPSSSSSSGATSSASAAAKFKACVVSDTGTINDKSFNQSAYAGATGAAAASGGKITAQYLSSASAADYAPNITSFINQKCGIIVTNGFLMGAATNRGEKANPTQKFAIIDFQLPQTLQERQRPGVQHRPGRLPEPATSPRA
jgi:basic membrane protein A